MNKQHLIDAVAATLGSKAAPGAVEAVLDAIARELAAGGTVRVTGFGTFAPVLQASWVGRNPQSGDPVTIPERTRLKFLPSQNLLDLVNGDKKPPLNGSAIAKATKGTAGGAR